MIILFTGCTSERTTSLSVIGGADGPTAIFVTGDNGWFGIVGVILAILLVVAVIVYFIKRKSK